MDTTKKVTKITYNGINLPLDGGTLPTITTGGLFTGATIPLTYKDNTHEKENNYEYKSKNYNITITGLDGRATITGNGTKEVLVAFDVTSATSSLQEFTITLTSDIETVEYKGLHAHYGSTVTGILTLAYNNIPRTGTGTVGVEYMFIEASELPCFPDAETLYNGIYSYQLLNVLIGNHSGSIDDMFLTYCYSFNQPLDLSNITSIGMGFLGLCSSFNQPLDLSNITSIGMGFLLNCYSFNQPLDLSNITSIDDMFLSECFSFNQPLDLSNVTSIGDSFLSYCSSFNQPLDLSNVTSIDDMFLIYCYSFNQPLDLSNVTSIGNGFLIHCYSFNQSLDLSNVTSIGGSFLSHCSSFNQPLDLSNVTSIGYGGDGGSFLSDCYSFNQPLEIPVSLNSIHPNYFMLNCYSLSTIIWNAEVFPTYSDTALTQDINSKTSTSGTGIKVYGTNRAGLLTALPNSESWPLRKLIDGGAI